MSCIGFMYSDVFLSFRGKDVRKSFVSHLNRQFTRKGIKSFMTEDEEERRSQISPTLTRALLESRVALVLISKKYAASSWCLDELVKIMNCARKKSTVVVPVFYEVDLSDVRDQKGRFQEDFERHGQVENPETLQRWRQALIKLTNKSGFSSYAWKDDSELIREITHHVSGLLSKSRLPKELLPDKACGDNSTAQKTSLRRLGSDSDQLLTTISHSLVAMDRHMKGIYGVLKLQSTSEVRVIGISGVTGVGKTTIARFVHRELSSDFQNHCFLETSKNIHDGKRSFHQDLSSAFQNHCFLQTSRNIHDDVQEIGKTSIVSSLYPSFPSFQDQRHAKRASSSSSREELFSPRGLKRKASQISSELDSYDKRTIFWHQRVLVIVDNVETLKQLEEIMKDVNRLGSGSRVIITTQDKSLLLACGVEHVYEVDCLRYDEALELFSICAFKKQYPPENFEQLSVRAVQLTGCLPLGLRLLGSFLRDRNKKFWERELQRLDARQDKSIAELSELLKPSPQGTTKD